MHKRTLVVPGKYIDNELVESYELRGFQGQVSSGSTATRAALKRPGSVLSCAKTEMRY